MKIYVRKSLAGYCEKIADDWYRVTKSSIKFYEEMFGTPYPFDKLDSIFCPDYSMGAMENVGCIRAHERPRHYTSIAEADHIPVNGAGLLSEQ